MPDYIKPLFFYVNYFFNRKMLPQYSEFIEVMTLAFVSFIILIFTVEFCTFRILSSNKTQCVVYVLIYV